MFRSNPIGVLILALCGVAAVVLVWQIITGERLEYTGPTWLIWVLAAVLVGGSLYMLVASRIRREDQQWPNPNAGQKSLWRSAWDRIRGVDS
ncbi:MAG: hypothetical protein KF883_10105 [Thermomicrobiales bacterium]|nr:hypothetical protein [Thermomicrobiales bacterium]